MYSNDVIKLYFILKDYSVNLEEIIRNNNKEFNNEELLILIENIMCDLKDLNRNII